MSVAMVEILNSTRCPVCDGWKGSIYPVCRRCWHELPARLRGALNSSPLDERVMWKATVYLGLRESEVTPWVGRNVVASGGPGKRRVMLDSRMAAQVVVGGTAAFEWCGVRLGGEEP